jgi:hypothetical protein
MVASISFPELNKDQLIYKIFIFNKNKSLITIIFLSLLDLTPCLNTPLSR